MSKKSYNPSQQSRLNSIRNQLARTGEIKISALSRKFRVSEMTIRRDLSLLESAGEILRTHGGATSARRLTFEFTFKSKQQKHLDQKRKIAKQAVRHICDGQVIILDTGTTTLEIAKQICGKRKVSIITTSLAIASVLQFEDDIELILLGGYMRDGSPDMHGPLTEHNLDMFRADLAFLGADAIGSDGNIYTNDLRVRNLDIAIARVSKLIIPVADSSKLGRQAMCKILEPKDYHLLITDSNLDKDFVNKLKKQKVKIEIV